MKIEITTQDALKLKKKLDNLGITLSAVASSNFQFFDVFPYRLVHHIYTRQGIGGMASFIWCSPVKIMIFKL